MKHIFIINPMAGKTDSKNAILAVLKKYDAIEYEFYETKAPKDATRFIREYCTQNPDEEVRFYACGCDGTINEVASGCVGFEHASMTVYPCGSGNDFVKYYGGTDAFMDIDALINAEDRKIDIIDCGNGHYAINVLNFGFDSIVCSTMISVKRKPIIGGKNAYTTGIVKALITGMRNSCVVKADGETLNPNGEFLLCTCANCQFVGGAYRCGPDATNDDGYMDVCLVKPLSRLKFPTMLTPYKNGKHLVDPRFTDYIVYRRCKTVELETTDPKFEACLDGEMLPTQKLTATIIPQAIRFAVPKTAKPII